MNELDRDVFARKLATLEPRVDATVIARSALAAAQRRERALPFPAWAIAVVTVALLALSSTAVAQNWFTEVFRIGNVFAAPSRPVSLSEARTTGLPVPSSSELPGGWKLRDDGAVQLTRTPDWTTVQLHYDRGGLRGMNVILAGGISLFDATTVEHDEALTVSGRTVYVERGPGEVRAFLNVGDVDIEIFVFGPALAGPPLTADEISDLVRSLIG